MFGHRCSSGPLHGLWSRSDSSLPSLSRPLQKPPYYVYGRRVLFAEIIRQSHKRSALLALDFSCNKPIFATQRVTNDVDTVRRSEAPHFAAPMWSAFEEVGACMRADFEKRGSVAQGVFFRTGSQDLTSTERTRSSGGGS